MGELHTELRDILAGWPIGDGYYGTSISIDEAKELAEFVLKSLLSAGYKVVPLKNRPNPT